MADSHDNLDAIKKVVRFFQSRECELVIHAGDFVAPFAARELENLRCPVKAVFGNCDGEKKGLEKALLSFGKIQDAPLSFLYKNLRFLVVHMLETLDIYPAYSDMDIIITAHTHSPEIREEGRTLLINPGETGGWLSGTSTIAILDTRAKKAEITML